MFRAVLMSKGHKQNQIKLVQAVFSKHRFDKIEKKNSALPENKHAILH